MRHSFDAALAVKYGLNESIILCQLEFWVRKNRENNKNFREGRYWTYNTNKELTKYFPYLTERQINYTIQKLKKDELIITGNFNKQPLDRTIWYTLTDKAFSILQNCEMQFTNLSNANDKIVKCYNNKDIQNNTQIERQIKAPTLEEIKVFAKENSLSTLVHKFFKYYEIVNWQDKDGKPVNWKQKLLSWGNREGLVVFQQDKPTKNFNERKYTAEEIKKRFQSLDEIDV